LKEKLEALEEKPHKVSLDYFNIEQAQKKLTALEERLESFNSHVNDATPLQDKVAKEVNAIIGEFSGGTDDKSGTQNLLDIIEAAQRSRGDTRFGGEFLARTEGFEKWKQRSEMRAGIMDRRSRGEFLIGEESILNDLNKEIPGLEKALVENARNRIKVMIEDARAGRDSGIKGLLGEFGRSPDAFLKPGAGMSPVDREFGAMLEQARGVNIQAREEEDAAERRAESARQNNADIQKIRKKADAARAQEAKAAADQAAGLDAANVRANEEYNRLQAATARNEAKDDRSQATSQRKADAAQAKAEREMAAAAKQDARDQIENYKMGLAQDIYNAAGGQLNPQGAMAAAQRAMQNMRQGQNEQQAAWSAMFETIQNLEQEAARFQAGMMGVNHQVNMIRHAQRRNRAQRPGLLPFFGQ
jgi:hypothetical protein